MSTIINGFCPEIILGTALLLQCVLGVKYVKKHKEGGKTYSNASSFITTAALALAFCACLVTDYEANGTTLNGQFFLNFNTYFFKNFYLIVSIFVMLPLHQTLKFQHIKFYEVALLFQLSVFSGLLLIAASNFLSIYVVLEMQALCFYALTSSGLQTSRGAEAGVKYFFLGSLASVVLTLGIISVYYSFGTTSLPEINAAVYSGLETLSSALASNSIETVFMYGHVMLLIAIGFKLGLAPFHFWMADVYEGSVLFGTIVFTVLPKIGLITLLTKVLSSGLNYLGGSFLILEWLGVLTVIVGIFFTAAQVRLKRLIIFSSLVQVGFSVASLEVNSIDSVAAFYFFYIVYIITSLALWLALVMIHNSKCYERGVFIPTSFTVPTFEDVRGMCKANPVFAACFSIIFLSMTGLPGAGGFFAKYYVASSLGLTGKQFVIYVLLCLSSVLSGYYYMRFLKISFFETKNNSYEKHYRYFQGKDLLSKLNSLCLILLSLILVFLFFFPELLMSICLKIASCGMLF